MQTKFEDSDSHIHLAYVVPNSSGTLFAVAGLAFRQMFSHPSQSKADRHPVMQSDALSRKFRNIGALPDVDVGNLTYIAINSQVIEFHEFRGGSTVRITRALSPCRRHQCHAACVTKGWWMPRDSSRFGSCRKPCEEWYHTIRWPCTYIFNHIHMYATMRKYMQTYTHICRYINININTYIYIYINMTHIHS